jgi:hypothetical protein
LAGAVESDDAPGTVSVAQSGTPGSAVATRLWRQVQVPVSVGKSSPASCRKIDVAASWPSPFSFTATLVGRAVSWYGLPGAVSHSVNPAWASVPGFLASLMTVPW